MLEINPLGSLPANRPIPREPAEDLAKDLERASERRGEIEKAEAEERRPPAVTSDGHAGPGGRKEGRLNVVG